MKKSTLYVPILAALLSTHSYAYDAGDWILRAGLTQVSPQDSSGNVMVDGADLGIGVNVDNNLQLGLNAGYFINQNWNIELLAATPFSHDIGLDSVGALGNTKHLPPTVSANYFFADSDSPLQPYVGIGINYTVFFDEQFTAANREAGFDNLSLEDSWGLAAQIGFDYQLADQWHINASVRYIDISTQATFNLNGTKGKVDVDIDPFVYSLTIGYRF